MFNTIFKTWGHRAVADAHLDTLCSIAKMKKWEVYSYFKILFYENDYILMIKHLNIVKQISTWFRNNTINPYPAGTESD